MCGYNTVVTFLDAKNGENRPESAKTGDLCAPVRIVDYVISMYGNL